MQATVNDFSDLAFIAQIDIKASFTTLKIVMFVQLAVGWFELDLSLRTQVLNDGTVAILGLDVFEREILRINLGVTAQAALQGT